MTPAQIERLKVLQQKVRDLTITAEEHHELDQLQVQVPLELADNPNTPFVDETARPQTTGGDYFVDQVKRDVRETAEDVGRAAGRGLLQVLGEFLKSLFTRR